MAVELKVLFVEDTERSVKLVIRELRRVGFAPMWERVETAETLSAALQRRRWDLVISDASTATLDVPRALEITKVAAPGTPFIVVSGSTDAAAEPPASQAETSDEISNDNLGGLGPAVVRAVHRTPEAGSIAHLLLATQELERRRIARALHDELGQHLLALRLTLESSHDLTTAIALVDQALAHTRDFAVELWPTVLDDLGLEPALRSLASRHTRDGLACHVCAECVGRMAFAIETACFRIAQEAITNVERHAGATRVDVVLRRIGDELELEIRDNGTGFDVERAWQQARGTSIGLFAMRERAALGGGALEIVSATGRGTIVRVRMPCRAER